jgi:PAS domain S-box-containing protein
MARVRETGDLGRPIELALNPRDEIGALVGEFNRMAAELRRTSVSKTYVENILGSMSDALTVLDPDGLVQYANPSMERWLGYAEGAIRGKRFRDLVDQGSARSYTGWLTAVHRSGTATGLDAAFLRADGSRMPVSLSASLLRDAGASVGIVCVAQDMADRLALQAQMQSAKEAAEAANRAKSDFLARMSHEIRTPMNGVIGMTELLSETELSERQRRFVDNVWRSAQSLLGIINDILDFSKIEAGKLDLDDAPFDLRPLVDELAELFAERAHRSGVELLCAVAPDVHTAVRGDAGRLRQVLVNLLGNAFKFTAQGEVALRVSRLTDEAEGLTLRFEVRDTGCGISPEAKGRIFESFAQADGSITRKHGGTGLGLAISRRLVELMGGRMGLESTRGEGSTFWLELSFDLAEPPPTARLRAVPMQVLIADDNPLVREAAAVTIEALGWSATQAESGDQALQKVLQEPGLQGPNAVVLLDWQMPGLDGLATARAIRDALPACSVPLLFLFTAHPLEEARALPGIEAVNGVLAKSLAPSALYDSVMAERGRRLGAASLAGGAATPENHLSGVRILLVDDSDINREVAFRIFAGEGAEVHLANDGREALDWLAAHPQAVDIVLMDVHMPVMDGYEATRLIRQTPEIARLPVVALTADALQDRESVALEAGMSAFLSKPFDVPEAVALIRRLTGQAPGAPEPRQPIPPPAAPDARAREEEPGPDASPEPPFPGIALGQGLALWSDANIYRQYLRRFASAYADSASVIAAAEPDSARQLAHKLKGTAGNLGLTEVAARAGALERHLAQGAAPATDATSVLLTALQDALETVLGSIARYAPEEPAPLSPPPQEAAPGICSEPLRAQLATLLRQALSACERFDPMSAGPVVEALSAHLPAAQLDALRQAVEDFDAPAGAACVRALANALDLSLED